MNFRKLLVWTFVSLGILIAGYNWQGIRDFAVLLSYTPSAEIAALADQTSMTEKGRSLLYVTNPTIDNRETFNRNCPKREAGLNVLGCYRSGLLSPGKISLFRINNEQLFDEIEVTAAHEMLHAAYARLNYFEREKLDREVAAAAGQIPESDLTDVLKTYLRERDYNELHSHLGTEYSKLTPELEAHYRQYFSDRQRIVSVHLGNEALFADCERDEKFARSNLESTKSGIDSAKNQLTATRAEMDRRLAAGDTDGYNALVPTHNQLVRRHNQLVDQYNSQAQSYNLLVGRCNALSVSLDSGFEQIETIPTR